jgi:hypothetical protein
MVANLNTMVIYCGIFTLEDVGTAVNYCGIFITMAPGACTIKLFVPVIYRFLLKARVFVHGKPLQPNLIFVVNVRACPSEAPFRCSTLG